MWASNSLSPAAPPAPDNISRVFSFASTYSAADVENENDIRLVLSLRDSKRRLQMMKMVLVVLLPVLALTAIISVSLARIVGEEHHARQAKADIANYMHMNELCGDLQLERSAIVEDFVLQRLLNLSDVANTSTIQQLANITDKSLGDLTSWAQPGVHCFHSDCIFSSSDHFLSHIQQMRTVNHSAGVHDIWNTVAMYTEAIAFFTAWSERSINLPESDHMRDCLVASNALLRTTNAMTLMEDFGFLYFALCNFEDSSYHTMWKQAAAEAAYLGIAFTYCPAGKLCYEQEYLETPLFAETIAYTNLINSKRYENVCVNYTPEARYQEAVGWSKTRRKYGQVVEEMRDEMMEVVKDGLGDLINKSRQRTAIYSTLLVIVLTMSAAMSYWYINSIGMMLARIKQFANGLTVKKEQLKGEKEKTDTLLHQMLPWSVAEQLKANNVVSAEFFESISVYFSDIVGFVDISAKSSPHQVVDMLNSLYSTFDTAIDRYAVYKVETVGDSYMVASGLPERTTDHAAELAHMSLELILAVKECSIPHLPEERLRVRIGLHTGPAVAGVVGLTMPRYCLFGDTINTASRMETTCEPQRIQISEACKEALEQYGGFKTEVRGSIIVKGKGSMMTYWLYGCRHMTVADDSSVTDYHRAHNGFFRTGPSHSHDSVSLMSLRSISSGTSDVFKD